MARITVEDCLTKETNRFGLVQLAAKRTKQLLQGSKSLIADSKNRAVVTALREIASGNVRFLTSQEMQEKVDNGLSEQIEVSSETSLNHNGDSSSRSSTAGKKEGRKEADE